MEHLAEILLRNALLATVLAGVVALVARRRVHPAVLHVLWLLVLAKLVTPALIPVAVLPAGPEVPAASVRTSLPGAALVAEPAAPEASGEVDLPASGAGLPRSGVLRAFVAVNLVVAGAMLVVAALRLARFRRRLAGARDASPSLRRRTAELAARLGLRRTPRVRIADATLPPLVTPGPRGAEIVLPARLLARLADPQRDALLAHELAHVARGDAWVRPFELLVTALFWWHPVVWWARRRLRVAEERACDAVVLGALPGHGRDYAEALLRTLEFLQDRAPAPALATGAEPSHLEERLTMITKESSAQPLPRFRRPALALAGLALLLLFPVARDSGRALAESVAPPAPPAARVPAVAEPVPPRAPADVHFGALEALSEPLLQLRREEIALQRQFRELEIQRAKLERDMQEKFLAEEIGRTREEIRRHEQSGDDEVVQAMTWELKRLESGARLQRARLELELDQATARLEIEERLETLALERDLAGSRAEVEKVRALEKEAQVLELEMRRAEIEAMRKQLEFEEQELDARAPREDD